MTGKGIDDVSNDETTDDPDDSGERDGSSRLAERDTTDEDNSFHTLAEDGNEGQDEQDPLSSLRTTIHVYHTNALTLPRHCEERSNTNLFLRKPLGA